MNPTRDGGAVDASVVALLERRAARLRQQPEDEDRDDSFWVAEVSIGGASYAVPLAELLGVLPVRLVVTVPRAPPQVLGIVRFRGEMVTALSLAWLVGAAGLKRDPSVVVVIGLASGRKVAVDCEGVPKAMALPASIGRRAASFEPDGTNPILELPVGTATLRLVGVGALLEQRFGPSWGRT